MSMKERDAGVVTQCCSTAVLQYIKCKSAGTIVRVKS